MEAVPAGTTSSHTLTGIAGGDGRTRTAIDRKRPLRIAGGQAVCSVITRRMVTPAGPSSVHIATGGADGDPVPAAWPHDDTTATVSRLQAYTPHRIPLPGVWFHRL